MIYHATALKAALVLLFAYVACGVTSASANDRLTNLVTNPSLEDTVGADGLPPGWGQFYSNPAGAYRAVITDGGRTGKKEMRIDCVAEKKDDAQFGAMAANRIPLDSTKRYVARGWVKVAGGQRATADVKLHYYDAGGAYLGQTRIGFTSPGNDDWQLVTVTDHAAEFPQARMIGLAIACTGDAKAQYDDLELFALDKNSLPADFDETYGITRSPQLAVLARRVGTWETKTKIKPCLWVPQGLDTTSVETVRWSVGGQILESRQRDSLSGTEQLSLTTYDARDQVYRSWFFGSDGNLPRTETIGQWDKATATLTFKSLDKDCVASVVQMKLIGNDAVNWQGTWKDKAGQIVLDIEGTAKRSSPDRAHATSERGLPDRAPAVSAEAPPIALSGGVWLAESVTINGEVGPAAAVQQTWFKFDGTSVSFKLDGPEVKGKCTVDTEKFPREMDVTLEKGPGAEAGYVVQGIYELTGDRLEICFRGKTPDVRPADFSSKANSGRILVVLKKQNP